MSIAGKSNGIQGVNGAPFLNPFGPHSAAQTNYINAKKIIGHVQDDRTDRLWGINATVSKDVLFRLPGRASLVCGRRLVLA